MAVTLKESKTSLGEGELAQRVAVVKRFRELLVQQRERFRSYLTVLDRQQLFIGAGRMEELTAYVDLEEQIVADIFSIQKVIDPLELMYKAAGQASDQAASPYLPANDVPALKTTLEDLKFQAIARSERNREMLSDRMAGIRTEIKVLRNNPFMSNNHSLYQDVNTASLIDVMG